MGAARAGDIPVAGRGPGLPQRRFDSIGHKVERGATVHHERVARVMGEDKDRDVVGRIVAPPTGPALVPRAVAAAKHLAAHDVGANVREETADHFRVFCVGPALLTMLLPPAGRLEQPLVQPHAALPDWVLQALVGPSDKTVERDGDLARHGAHAFKTSSAWQNHRSTPPSLSPGHALTTSRS